MCQPARHTVGVAGAGGSEAKLPSHLFGSARATRRSRGHADGSAEGTVVRGLACIETRERQRQTANDKDAELHLQSGAPRLAPSFSCKTLKFGRVRPGYNS